MRKLLADEVLAVWERGQGQPPVQQALLLLAAAEPEMSWDALARLSIGQRDARLLQLREQLFGSQLTGLTPCPGCHEKVELTFNVQDLLSIPSGPALEPLGIIEGEPVYSVKFGDREVTFRLPNSFDAAALPSSDGIAAARWRLLSRCVLRITKDNEISGIQEVPPELLLAISEKMEQLDPLANIQLAAGCPACGHQWQEVLDIGVFLWKELAPLAKQLLCDVHTLASAYGWSEREILALNPNRRRIYLELLRT